MTYPSSDVSTTNLDAGTDSRAAARVDLLDLANKFNQLRNHISSWFQTFLTSTSADVALTNLGGTATGKSLFTATTEANARSALSVAPRATRVDVPSSSTVNLTTSSPDCDDIRLTGTTPIDSFTVTAGRVVRVICGDASTLTASSSIITHTGFSIKYEAGDSFTLRATAANIVEVISYTKPAKFDSGLITLTGASVDISVPENFYEYKLTISNAQGADFYAVILHRSGVGSVGSYSSQCFTSDGTTHSSTESSTTLIITTGTGNHSTHGTFSLVQHDGPLNSWVSSSSFRNRIGLSSDVSHFGCGRVSSLSDAFNIIRINCSAGFTAGTARVHCFK